MWKGGWSCPSHYYSPPPSVIFRPSYGPGTRTVIIVFITLRPRRPRRHGRPHLHSITETRVRVHQKYPGIQPSMPDGQGDNKGWLVVWKVDRWQWYSWPIVPIEMLRCHTITINHNVSKSFLYSFNLIVVSFYLFFAPFVSDMTSKNKQYFRCKRDFFAGKD